MITKNGQEVADKAISNAPCKITLEQDGKRPEILNLLAGDILYYIHPGTKLKTQDEILVHERDRAREQLRKVSAQRNEERELLYELWEAVSLEDVRRLIKDSGYVSGASDD